MKILSQGRVFADRREAGFELGEILKEKYGGKNALVLGIPRGGVVVAYEVAKALRGELSVVVTKKLPHPQYEEYAIGAVAEDGSVYLTSAAEDVRSEDVRQIIRAQEREITSRINRFRKSEPLPEMRNRIVIITDDGIATGSTLVPAIKLCQHKQAALVVVAAPVSGERYMPDIDGLANEVIIVEQPEEFEAVGQVYEDFHSLSDKEVLDLLNDFKMKHYYDG